MKRLNDNQHALTLTGILSKTCVNVLVYFFKVFVVIFNCFGFLTRLKDLVNFVLKKENVLCIKTLALVCFSSSPFFFLTLPFPL